MLKKGDIVNIKSKSVGCSLEVHRKYRKNYDGKRVVIRSVSFGSYKKTAFVIDGDYFLEEDLEKANPQEEFDFGEEE